MTFLNKLLEKLDNDTLIVFGLIAIAFIFAAKDSTDYQIVSNIISIFGGYLGGQYVATKNNLPPAP